jgi:DNA-binding response OmpR family regulator
LIVDPDWRFAKQAGDFMESLAHLVICTARGDEAMDRARHWQPDLVILDAELAGKGLIDSINAMSPRPAVLLTGWMDRYDVVWRAWQKGGDELLMKPVFRSTDLLEAIVTARENAATGERPARTAASA